MDKTVSSINIKPKKNLRKLDSSFFMSDHVINEVTATIDRIERNIQSQAQINSIWSEIKNLFLNELDKLPDLPSINNKQGRKVFRKHQPFWNDELTKSEDHIQDSCNVYVKGVTMHHHTK